MIPQKVTVICEPCSADTNEPSAECVEMTLKDKLSFNPETLSQSQRYECRECEHTVTVLIEVGK